MENRKETIIQLLRETKRPGIEGLIEYMDKGGYFSAPASTKYHGCYEGGLAEHSGNVYELLRRHNVDLDLKLADDTLAISALLHDLCKMGAYLGSGSPY
jgi:23S rRNA maturation-related 3'-5' exoribonuclease YhaM